MGKISYDDKLRKGPMSTKLTRPHSTHSYHVWCVMLQAFHKLQSKPKTIPELKSALQQICDDLPQTTINKAMNDFRKHLKACVSADGGHFEHYDVNWVVVLNIA